VVLHKDSAEVVEGKNFVVVQDMDSAAAAEGMDSAVVEEDMDSVVVDIRLRKDRAVEVDNLVREEDKVNIAVVVEEGMVVAVVDKEDMAHIRLLYTLDLGNS
jgi:ribosomal protein L10